MPSRGRREAGRVTRSTLSIAHAISHRQKTDRPVAACWGELEVCCSPAVPEALAYHWRGVPSLKHCVPPSNLSKLVLVRAMQTNSQGQTRLPNIPANTKCI
ncbi:hypothetical protein NP493_203g02019 [Ridgeia piscesae]|uniref:Uncharacterized protein n=1 Tax=Ridgeia piscesae TaxID=27915 RepID=A0AAD9P1F1_RIDPI|nr:hypothetical protein NP493_203g02019 [Ridgeia piscesae]